MKIHIGLVGEKGSGKETFVNFLKEIIKICKPNSPIVHFRFSDILGETLMTWGIEKTRGNYQTLPQAMKHYFGDDVLSKAVKKRMIENDIYHLSDIIILDGLRWREDVKMFGTLENNILIYITAEPKIRYERMKNRNEKVGENTATFEQFTMQELAKTEILIPIIGKENAHLKIENNDTLKQFEKQVKLFYETVIKNGNGK